MVSTRVAESVSGRVRQAREELGLTQAELGQRVGLSAASVSKRETGVADITADELREFARVLGKPVEWFYGDRWQSIEDPRLNLMFYNLRQLSSEELRVMEEWINSLLERKRREEAEEEEAGAD